MSVWKKMKQLIPLKHVIFVLVLLTLVMVISFFESGEDIKVTIEDKSVTIKASNYQMNIPYEMIATLELADMPDKGDVISGNDNLVVRTGNWKNEIWGEYYICADLDATKCIVAHLNDGRIFVFNRKSNTETEEIYRTLQTYLLSSEAAG